MLVAITKWGKWSDMVNFRLPETISWELWFEKILSIIDSEWEVILAGWIR